MTRSSARCGRGRRQLEKEGSGTGWYTDNTKEAVVLTSLLHPEVLTPEGRTTFLDLAGMGSPPPAFASRLTNAWRMA